MDTKEDNNKPDAEEQEPVIAPDSSADEIVEELETNEARSVDEPMEPIVSPDAKQRGKLGEFIHNHKKLVIASLVVCIALILICIFVTPVRNVTFGMFMKTKIQLEVYDEISLGDEQSERSELSDFTVKIDGQEVATEAKSPLELTVKPGKRTVEILKENYTTASQEVTANLALGSQTNAASIKMEANGRPYKVSIVNAITKETLANAKVSFNDASAESNENGEATIILPVQDSFKYELQVEKDGYVSTKTEVEVPKESTNDASELGIVPEGKVYFLSKAEGTIDVVKANLDGSDREVVLEGTGKENDEATVMVATRDWKYLALLSSRDGKDKIWVIDTATNKATAIEDADAMEYKLHGWNDTSLVYGATNTKLKYYANGHEKLKSYNAAGQQYATLDQTSRANTAADPEAYWGISNVVLMKDTVAYVYSKSSYTKPVQRLQYINPDGSNKRSIYTVKNLEVSFFTVNAEPEELYFSLYNSATYPGVETYYEVDNLGTSVSKIEKEEYYPYLLSPSGDTVVWNERRDGKSTLIVGDTKLENGKEIYTKSEYSLYGWFNDDYLLVSKDDSELYITDAKKAGTPLKISDYHKVDYEINSYGGGYGGGL